MEALQSDTWIHRLLVVTRLQIHSLAGAVGDTLELMINSTATPINHNIMTTERRGEQQLYLCVVAPARECLVSGSE